MVKMVSDLTTRPWVGIFAAREELKPVVIVGTIRNLSAEHIQTLTFIKNLERELVNSGRAIFVTHPLERGDLRKERKEKKEWARPETRKKLRAETGADFMLIGSINQGLS